MSPVRVGVDGELEREEGGEDEVERLEHAPQLIYTYIYIYICICITGQVAVFGSGLRSYRFEPNLSPTHIGMPSPRVEDWSKSV